MATRNSWMNPKLEAGSSPKDHQRGIFAKRPVRKDERLAIWGGDILRIDEIKNVPESLQHYPLQLEERFVIFPRQATEPEDTDFFNHSCDPNSGIKGQIFLVAMRDIEPGEEVTFDYAMVVSESVGSEVVFEMDCNCGSRHCRGKVTEQDWKLPELRRRYNGYFSQYLQEKIAGEG